ncbi:MAG: aldehyde ferredoxin oxidoreductase family protein [Candidatus Thorarchaeota archaeon]
MTNNETFYGYAGHIADIDLSKSKVDIKPLESEFARKYLGGTGFAARILWDRVKPSTNPLDPDNPLLFGVGPVTGAFFTPSGRFMVAFKSPLTGLWGEAHCGGHWGPQLKYAGFDMLIIQGRAPKPVYLMVRDGEIKILDANHLWTRDTTETTDMIKEEQGDNDVEVASIGIGGENQVRYAAIIGSYYRAAGRAGGGAVMGSKNLKAIAARGFGGVRVANPGKFMAAARKGYEQMTTGKWGEMNEESLGKYGTTNLVTAIGEIGRLPTKNHSTGVFNKADAIGPDSIRHKYRTSREACFGCALQCKYTSQVKSGPYKVMTGGPEYETIMAFGSNCLNSNVESILYANQLCNRYGIDTISTGCTIAFLFEAAEHGIITSKEADGLDLSWGNAETIIALIEKIAHREGIGNLLAEGSMRAAQKIGKGAERFAIHVKGLEASGQDPRPQQSVGLTYATNVRGADHLRSLSCYEELGFPDVAIERFGEEHATDVMDLHSTTFKGHLIKDQEDLYVLVDSVILCKYGTMWPPVYYFDIIAEMLHPLTGFKEFSDVKQLRLVAERISNLRRCFNVREGVTREREQLHPRFTEEPIPEGPAKGQVCNLDPMLDEYYSVRNWTQDGLPTRSELRRLGLDDVADELAKLGKVVEK